jgi:type II secretory pathway pseudopilin PulG
MKNKQKSLKAFSLTELSIVIVIIGVVVISVIKGGLLVSQFRMATARSLTKSSPVASTSGLVLWLETTTEGSFDSYNDLRDGSSITTWHDISQQKKVGFDATQSGASTLKPVFAEYSINSLPTLRFDGDDYLSFDNSRFLDGKLTMFILVKYDGYTSSNQYIIARYDGSSINGGNMVRFIFGADTVRNDIFDAGSPYPTATASIDTKPFIIRVINDGANAKLKINNEVEVVSTDTISGYNLANSSLPAAIGCRPDTSTVCLTGNIGEIIVFNRVLSSEENDAIQDYLNKKWKIY